MPYIIISGCHLLRSFNYYPPILHSVGQLSLARNFELLLLSIFRDLVQQEDFIGSSLSVY